jgi:hypothetical protein
MIQQALVVLTLAGGVAASGCASGGRAAPEAEVLSDVQVFRTSPPVCPYARVGEIRPGGASMRSIRDQVRAAGGDALVMTRGAESPPAVGAAPSGIIIRFTDPDCRR